MKIRRSFASITTKLPREKNDRGDLGPQSYQFEASMRPLGYEKKPGAGFRLLENRADEVGLFDGYYGFDELLVGGIIRRLQKDSPVLKVMYGDAVLDLEIEGTNDGVLGELSYSNGSAEIFYPNAWKNADLRYILGGHLIAKQIHLHKDHPAEFTFRLAGQYQPRVVGDHIELGNELAIIQPYLVYDSGDPSELSPLGNGQFQLQLKWRLKQQNDALLLSVELPEGDWAGWMLDPSVTLQPGATGIDAFVYLTLPAGNYGDSHLIQMNHGGPTGLRGYIKFDLSSIVDGSNIVTGTFSTWMVHNIGSPSIRHDSVDAAWAEKNITWNNKPAATGGLVMPDGARDGVPTVSSIAAHLTIWQDWLDDPTTNHGFRMTTLGATYTYVHSSDSPTAASRPRLTIQYTPPSGRLTAYSLNVWDPDRHILDRQGYVVPPNEVRPDNWLDLEGLEIASARTFPSYVEDPSKVLIVESRYREGQDVPEIKTDRSQFGDVIVERVAGGHAG